MKLNGVTATNLFSFERLKTNTPDGKTLIIGVNNDEIGLSSNGAGKSAIFGVVYWTLFGKTLDGRSTDEVLRKGAKDGLGILSFSDAVVISRSIEANGNKHLTVIVNGEDRTASTNTKTQELLDEILGCDAKSFLHSHYMSSDFSKAFIGKDTTPKERFNVFEKFIDAETLTACKKLCDTRIREGKSRVERLEGEADGYRNILTEYDEEHLQSALLVAEERLTILDVAINTLTDTIKRMDTSRDAYSVYEANKDTLLRISIAEKDLATWEGEELLEDVGDMIEANRNKISEMTNVLPKKTCECPACGTPLSLISGVLKRATDEEEETFTEEIEKLKRGTAELTTQQGRREYILSERSRLKHDIELLVGSTKDVDEAEAKKFNQSKYEEAQTQLSDTYEEINKLRVDCDGCNRELKSLRNAQDKLTAVEKNMDIERKGARNYVFWKDGFQQIKANRIEAIIPLFENETNEMLHRHFEFDYAIRFTTVKKLKSGGEKMELNIIIEDADKEERSFESCSMGEQTRVAIAVTLARNSIFASQSNLDFILIDELLDKMDGVGQEMLVHILHGFPTQCLIISHSDIFKSVFVDIITVIKENGVSEVV